MSSNIFKIAYLLLLALTVWLLSASSAFADNQRIINFKQLSTEQGLSHNYAYRIIQDSNGFIWIGTQDGVNRYDGHEFTVYRNNPEDSNSIIGNDVRAIFEDSNKNLWFAARGKGLSRYLPATNSFSHYRFDQANSFNAAHIMTEISEGPNGNLWLGTRAGLIKFDPRTESHQTYIINREITGIGNRIRDMHWLDNNRILLATGRGLRIFNVSNGENQLLKTPIKDFEEINFGNLVIDQQNNIWASSLSQAGIYRIASQELLNTQSSYPFAKVKGSNALGRIYCLYVDNQGVVWIGTRSKGIYYFDPNNAQFYGYAHQPGIVNSLAGNAVLDLFQDQTGLFWAGIWSSGVSTFNLNQQNFKNFASVPYNSNSLAGKNIWDLMRTKDGRYWFGSTDKGLTSYNPLDGSYQHYSHRRQDPESLSGHRVWALGERDDGLLWLGLYFRGLDLFNPQTGKVVAKYYQAAEGTPRYPHGVMNMTKTSDGSWWFGTRLQGLARWQESSQSFKFYSPDSSDDNSLPGVKVFATFEDSLGRFWIGMENGGLSLYRPQSDDFKNYRFAKDDPNSIASDVVLSLGEDAYGRLLVGTEQGLSRMLSDGVFEQLNQKHGLANDTINGILRDCHGDIWLATNQSLSHISQNDKIINFDKRDGLVSAEFNTSAYRHGQGCELLFGASEGAISFIPKKLDSGIKPHLVLSKLLKFYKPYQSGIALSELTELNLSYRDQVVSFAFALDNYNNPHSHRFSYRLLDSNNDGRWIDLGRQNIITLTSLSPGSHLLEVKGMTDKGLWSDVKQINIEISSPWWSSWWAYLIYFTLFISVIGGYFRLQQQKFQAQQKLTIKEREVANQLRNLDKMKDLFLANTSHELRTPLNAIIGLSEIALLDFDLIDKTLLDKTLLNKNKPNHQQTTASVDFDSKLKLIRDSGKRLLTLVSDILDFSALAEKKLRINCQPVSMGPIVENLVLELQLLNKNPQVTITSQIESDLPKVMADEHRLYQILLNLLSNAVKFTEQGTIQVTVKSANNQVRVIVKDSGIGIPSDQLDSVFKRFEQVDASISRRKGGTGLGLAITKELVELHKGTISVQSMPAEGSTFIIEIPVAE